MTHKFKLTFCAMILVLGVSSAHSVPPCGKCDTPVKKKVCLKKVKTCLKAFDSAGEKATTEKDFDDVYDSWMSCVSAAEKGTKCSVSG